MTRLPQFFLLFFIFSCNYINKSDLSAKIKEMNVSTILISNSNAIDEYPLWSSDSYFLAANIDGEWVKFDLKNIEAQTAVWHNKEIAVLVNKKISVLHKKEEDEFRKITKNNGRKIITKSGTIIELNLEGFSSSLSITKEKNNPQMVWRSNMENCHSLSLSPNEIYISYICELNGLFITKI